VVKDPSAVQVRFALCFPDAYEIGMSHLGLRILYSQLNRDPRIWAERAFSPMPDMERQLRERSIPLTTLESGTPLAQMDVLGFSLQHELCATNLLQMLDLAGLPLRAADRGDDAPLVLVGGPAASSPEPIAPFIDAVALGDGEELAGQVALTWVEARRGGADRAEALAILSRLPSVYVPARATLELDAASGRMVVMGDIDGTPSPLARAAWIADLDAYPFPDDGPVALTEAVFDRAMIEIARGCLGGCRFCQAGMIYRPARERRPDEVLRCLLAQTELGGYDEASLTSLSTADYSQVVPLVREVAARLGERNVALSVSSLRAHGLDQELTEALARVRTSSLTLAPEAGSQRLREVINKNITEAEIIRGARAAISSSRRRIKLYFMIGLPTETEDDLRAIIELAIKIRDAVAGRGRRQASIAVAASTFVPKPHTPLQWCRAIGPDEVRAKHQMLYDALKPARIELRTHDVRLSMLEAILSRADRRAADLIEAAYRAGARFDGWDEHFDDDAWRVALESWPIDPADLRREIPLEARLPWDHLAMGPSIGFLKREHRRALAARATPICFRPDPEGGLVCNHCGLECDLEAEARRQESLRLDGEALSEPPLNSVGVEQRGQEDGAETPERDDSNSSPEPAVGRVAAPVQVRLRLVVQKRGALMMLGHLDTLRMLARLLRRAGLVLAYSQGFHPKPKLSMAAPLTLGLAGLAEVVDLTLEDPPAEAEALRRLIELSPEGLVPLALRRLGQQEPGAASSVIAAELLVCSGELPPDLDRLAAEILARPRLEVERPKKGAIDLRPSLLSLAPFEDPERLAALGLSLELPAMLARASLNRGPSIRPEDLCAWLGLDLLMTRVYRLALLAGPKLERLE
jgi:radical SAM family uncharacterized protein/radical SAM-linked protein